MSSTDDEDFKYDVFLSFRGEDTRNNFISHLHAALSKKNIKIFIDYQLRKGYEISPSLLTAIEESRISIVVFSKGYASSTWCLQELEKILECRGREMYSQIVIPVFHGINPSDVRKQTGTFRDAFAKHEQVFGDKSEKLQRWRTALSQAANLSGWDSSVIWIEYVLVNKIVKDVLRKLAYFSPITKYGLVGIELKVNQIESSLCAGSNDVRSLGIWGTGGIGKTILAEAVFNKIACQFEGSYFIHNVRARMEEPGGLNRLRKELLYKILGEGNVNADAFTVGQTFTRNRLGHKKLLIVFDDVADFRQIEILIRYFNFLDLRSRIIITSRDKYMLKDCRVHCIYQVNELYHDEALKLFSRHAFKQNHPPVEYMELSNKMVSHIGGIPLPLKVLGSMLLDRSKPEWETVASKITRSIDNQVLDVLKISYDELDDSKRSTFLDIACFFVGEDIDLVETCMPADCFKIDFSCLMDKSLLTESKNKIEMHNLIQAMGREIVRTESIENPAERSRLWHHEDIYGVLKRNTGTDAVEGISLDMSKIRNIQLDPRAFSKMHNLRFLKFYSSDNEMNSKVHLSQATELPSAKLSYFYWHAYPLKSLPSDFYPRNLHALHLPYSNLEQLPDDKHFYNVNYINLSHSKLTKIPDILVAPSLESLILEGCNNLLEIPSSIGYLDKLVTLNLRDCKSLKSLPNYIHLKSLKILILSGCSNLNKFPEMLGNIQELYLGGTIIEELPSSIEHLSCLVILDLENCSRLTCLPNGICKLKCLEELNLIGCSKLGRLPDDLGNLKALKKLKVSGTGVREVPSSIAGSINSGTLSIERGQGQELMGLQLPSLLGLYDLTNLVLSDCNIKELPESLGSLSSVKMLTLCRNNFESIPANIINLSKLTRLNICYCERLKSLPILPRDLQLVAHNCTSLEEFSGLTVPFTHRPSYILAVDFINCSRLHQNTLEYLVGHALNKILFIPSALYTELDEESYDEMPNVFICYPGNEVPEWFTFQSTESFVIVRPPPGWFSDNLVGLAICAVVAFEHHYYLGQGLVLVCECEFKSEDGYRHVARGYFIGWGNDKYGIHYVGSDHVFLGCDFVMYPENFGEDYYTNEFSVQFYIEDYYSERMHSCEVKKCGVRLIYRHEFGNSIPSTSSNEDYFCKYLEEDNGSFCADLHMEEQIPHGPHQKSSKLPASFKDRRQIKDELILSSEARLLERVSGGDIRSQALRTPDHLKRGCVGGMGEQRLVELEDTEQVNNNMRRESNKEQSNLAKRKRVEEYSIEECMQMIEELDVDDDVFAKLMEKIVSLEWRKIFLTMSEKRRKTWVQRL